MGNSVDGMAQANLWPMATATSTTQISAAPAAVWAVLDDPARMADWVTIHQGYVGEPPASFAAGTRFTQRASIMGMPADVAWEVTEADAPSKAVMAGAGPMGIKVASIYTLAASDAGTSVTWTMEFSGGMVMAVGAQLESQVSGAQRTSLEALKQLVEG
jgi:carbon monoxide dehydrogenase subunit G